MNGDCRMTGDIISIIECDGFDILWWPACSAAFIRRTRRKRPSLDATKNGVRLYALWPFVEQNEKSSMVDGLTVWFINVFFIFQKCLLTCENVQRARPRILQPDSSLLSQSNMSSFLAKRPQQVRRACARATRGHRWM